MWDDQSNLDPFFPERSSFQTSPPNTSRLANEIPAHVFHPDKNSIRFANISTISPDSLWTRSWMNRKCDSRVVGRYSFSRRWSLYLKGSWRMIRRSCCWCLFSRWIWIERTVEIVNFGSNPCDVENDFDRLIELSFHRNEHTFSIKNWTA